MHSAVSLFDALAAEYDEHFAAPHRRAYDDLAWELTTAALPAPPATVIDVGCGVGRWTARLIELGYDVIGVEPAPTMADEAQRRLAGQPFRLVRATMEVADLPLDGADAVVAMGSLQYADDSRAALTRFTAWVRPGGWVCVLVDSLMALVVELLRDGRDDEAMERLATRRGVWTQHDKSAELELFDAAALRAAFDAAALEVEVCAGLLVGASVLGRAALNQRLAADYSAVLQEQRVLAGHPELADLGKQLYVAGRRTARPAPHPSP